jgi:hypothetical protein
MTSRWPTDLEVDGTAPVNIALVASGDEHLMRQAMYQLQAATRLQDRGFTLDGFQIPIVGKMVRITVPIGATTPGGQTAAVYTQSEEWTPDRIGDLRTWVANLREESDVAVIVASRLPPPGPSSAPEISDWLHLPYDTLNKPASPAHVGNPAADAGSPASSSELALLPCLKEAKWRGREHTVCRALWESESSPYMPWLAVGYDHPHTFEFINTDRLGEFKTTEKALEAQALANLRARPATWEPVDVDVKGSRLRILTCSGDYFAAEHVLNPAFMQQAQRTLKTHGLFVGVPRRGLLMAAAAGQDQQMIAAFGAAVAGQFSRGETAVISPMLFAMKDGAIVGVLETVAEAMVPDGKPTGAPEDRDEHEGEGDPNEPFVAATATSAEPVAAVTPEPAKPPRPRSAWMRPTRWVMALAGAAVAYVAINWPSVQAYPNTINFGSEPLTQVTKWHRGGLSAAVYVPAGETMPGASLQVGVLVSTEHATAPALLGWIRDQALRAGEQRYHDSGTDSETCVAGLSSQPMLRTYLALQMCKTGDSRAACIESDRTLDGAEFGSCTQNIGCFEDACNTRWLEERDTLDAILSGFLQDEDR